MLDPEILIAETTPTLRAYMRDSRSKVLPVGGYTVDIIFKKPDGTTFTRPAVITSPNEGIVEYVVQAADIPNTDLGIWQRQWLLTATTSSGTTILRSVPRSFQLVERL